MYNGQLKLKVQSKIMTMMIIEKNFCFFHQGRVSFFWWDMLSSLS
jgi:hypothetical protein